MRTRPTITIATVLAALVTFASVPAFAQEDGGAPADERIRHAREWPPAWLDKPLEELKAEVDERAAVRIERIEASERLDEDQRADLLESIDSMLLAIEGADTNADVVGLVISRSQLQRQELRSERRGGIVDLESHIAADLERAMNRFDRLTKVSGWAAAAGEDAATILGYLNETETHLTVASGDGSTTERHDGVHIALAWMIEAAAALDAL